MEKKSICNLGVNCIKVIFEQLAMKGGEGWQSTPIMDGR
jgi:hypothetical protein